MLLNHKVGMFPASPPLCVLSTFPSPAECLAIPTEWNSCPDSDPSASPAPDRMLCYASELWFPAQHLSSRCPAAVLKSVVLLGRGARGCFWVTLSSRGMHTGPGAGVTSSY